MRILLFFLLFSFVSFSQSKKKQIEVLNIKLDSVFNVLELERKSFIEQINIANQNINTANKNLQKLKDKSAKKESDLKTKINQYGNEIIELKAQLQALQQNKDILSRLIVELRKNSGSVMLPTFYADGFGSYYPENPKNLIEYEDSIKAYINRIAPDGYLIEDMGPKGSKGEPFEVWMYFGSGICEGEVDILSASSTHIPNGANTYGIENLTDGDPRTAWVNGGNKGGIGESIVLGKNSFDYQTFVIYNGYQKSIKSWKENSRVKKFKLYYNNIPFAYLYLDDKMGPQSTEFSQSFADSIYLSPSNFKIKFEIVEVYEGDKYKDVAISDIQSHACCFSSSTNISSLNGNQKIESIEKGSVIKSIDLKTNKIFNVNVETKVSVKHHHLLKIYTDENTLELTANHPLYFEGYGLSSLAKMRSKLKAESFFDLEGKIKVLMWNKQLQKTEYKTIEAIRQLKGAVQTHSILKLSKGENYIANGFISKTY
tara:strand:+ start:939 stop:2393 length:1455 start_codon:yes stop_codon:yes gene_type:complete